MILPFCQKRKDNPLPKKIHLKVTFPASLKKWYYGISAEIPY